VNELARPHFVKSGDCTGRCLPQIEAKLQRPAKRSSKIREFIALLTWP